MTPSFFSPRKSISWLGLGILLSSATFLGGGGSAWGGLVFLPHVDYDTLPGDVSIASGDLDRDGDPDLAVTNSTGVSIFLNNGAGAFQERQDLSTGTQPRSIAIADLNGDGILDLALANTSSNSVSILFGTGDGSFGVNVDFGTGGAPTTIGIADLNGDRSPDLVVSNSGDNSVSVLLNNGTGGFGAKTDFATGANPRSVEFGDLNADGREDVVVVNAGLGANSVSVLLGNGDGTLQAHSDYATWVNPRSVTVADLNLDGRLDLAVANIGDLTGETEGVSILLGNGDGTFQPRADHAIGPQPGFVAAGDLTGDGIPDLAVAITGGIHVDALLGHGDGTFPDVGFYETGEAPVSLVIADLNVDGRLDIAAVNGTDRTMSVLLNVPDTAPTLNPIADMTVDENATADQVISGSDAEGQHLSLSLVAGPPYASAYTLAFQGGTTTGNIHLAPGFSDAGTAAATVQASDGSFTDRRSLRITVNNVDRPPVSIAGGPYSGIVNVPVAFDGTGSSDPDGETLTYHWDFGDGGSGLGATPMHSYANGGTFTVTLTVSDGVLSNAASSTASVEDTFQARAFTTNPYRTLRLASGNNWCVQIEPVNGSFPITAVLGSTVTMLYGADHILATPAKAGIGADRDGNGVQELTACFSKADLRTLLAGLPKGESSVPVLVAGNLSTGGTFHALLTVDVVNAGSALAALVSPNPMNPEATLTFTTSQQGHVKASVFDVAGRVVRVLLDDGSLPAGYHDVPLDGRGGDGERLGSGVYFYRIESDEGLTTGRFGIAR